MDNQIYTHSYFVNTLKAHVELEFSLPPKMAAKAIEILEQQQREIERLRRALSIYADENHYATSVGGMRITATAMIDQGATARQALREDTNG